MNTPEIFSADWFSRDSKNYTVADKSKSLGWEALVNGKFSKYLYSQSIANALIYSSDDMRNEFMRILSSIDLGDRNVIVDTKGMDSCTDGKTIIVANNIAKTMSNEFDNLDIMLGLLLHEASHCKYTDFGYMRSNALKMTSLVHQLSNIIEDELIENKLGMQHPGFANYLAKLKYHYFGVMGHDLRAEKPVNELDEIFRLFFYIVRYPEQVADYDPKFLADHEEMFKKIHMILTECECFDINSKLSCTVRSVNAAITIVDLLRDMIDADAKKQKEEQREGGNSSNGDGTDWDSDDIDDYSDEVEHDEEQPKGFDEQQSEMVSDCNSVFNREIKMNSHVTDTASDFNVDMHKMIKKASAPTKSNNNAFKNMGCKLGHVQYAKNNPVRYRKILHDAAPYIKQAKSLILENESKDITVTNAFRRNGTLDANRLVAAMQNINTVYKQNTMIRKQLGSRYALVLILDESGSMYRVHDYVTSLAITISEAIKEFPGVELYVYGHGDTVRCYIDKYNKDLTNIGGAELQGEQNDYMSTKIILETVKKQTQLPIVCISFTDSCYCEYANMKVLFDTYRKKNVSFNLVAINEYINTNSEIAKINDSLYGTGNWVVANGTTHKDTVKMINTLGNLIRKNYKTK